MAWKTFLYIVKFSFNCVVFFLFIYMLEMILIDTQKGYLY